MKFADLAQLQEGARIVVEKGAMRATMTLVAVDDHGRGKCVLVQMDDKRFRRYRPCHIVEVTGEMRAVEHDDARSARRDEAHAKPDLIASSVINLESFP